MEPVLDVASGDQGPLGDAAFALYPTCRWIHLFCVCIDFIIKKYFLQEMCPWSAVKGRWVGPLGFSHKEAGAGEGGAQGPFIRAQGRASQGHSLGDPDS